MKTTSVRALWISLLFAMMSECAMGGVAKLCVVAVDVETGCPVPAVKVTGAFSMDRGWTAVTGDSGPNLCEGITDAKGRCKVSGRTNTGEAGCYVCGVPSGYYVSKDVGGRKFVEKNIFGAWQPDNMVVTLRLQRVEKPIPLFVKQIGRYRPSSGCHRMFPTTNDFAEISYDLLKGEWLPPLGSGKVADVTFRRLPKQSLGMGESEPGELEESYRHAMSVAFNGVDNGVVDCSSNPDLGLRIKTAPDNGYVSQYQCWRERNAKLKIVLNYDEDRCFCFRIRTKRNAKGEITEAYYGKIYGDISFASQVQPELVFVAVPCMRYYLNPTSLDRNLEWNMVNLCKDPGELDSPQP